MNGRTNSSGSSVNDLQIPLDPCTNLECVAGNAQVELTWTDPLNKYATPEGEVAEDPDQLVSVWHHTVVIRKVGSAPVGIDDGIVVVSSEVKNQYQSTAYIDTGLVNDTTYYYGVFAINEDGVESEGLVSEGVTPKLATPLSELAEGTIIKINERGSPKEFYLAKHNYEPGLNGQGRELVVRKDCYDEVVWTHNTTNAYATSLIDSRLNETYKNVLSASVRALIGTTKFYYTISFYESTVATLERAVFAMSATELRITDICANKEGSALPIASTLQVAYVGSTGVIQWTRSPSNNTYRDAWALGRDGSAGRHATSNQFWARPAFTLPDTARVGPDLALDESSLIS